MDNYFDSLVRYYRNLPGYYSSDSCPSEEAIASCRRELQKLHDHFERPPQNADVENSLDADDEEICRKVKILISNTLSAAVKVTEVRNNDQCAILQSGLSLILISADFLPSFTALLNTKDFGLTISQLLLNVFSLSIVEGESLPVRLRSILRNESIEKSQLDVWIKQELYGCLAIAHNIIDELILHQKQYISQQKYDQFDPNRLDVFINLLGQLKFLSEEEFSTLAEETPENSASADKCLSAVGAYANLAGFYIMILSWHKALADVNKANSALLGMKLRNATQEAKEFLGFLSNNSLLGPAGWWLGKLRLMKQFREHPNFFASIENIRISLGLQPTTYSSEETATALDHCLHATRLRLSPEMDWITKERKGERAMTQNENNNLCIVNKTPFGICVLPGLVFGNGAVNEQFAEMQQFIASDKDEWLCNLRVQGNFTTSGVLALGGHGLVRAPTELKDVKFIEFGFSNPKFTHRKVFTNPVDVYSKEHLKQSSATLFDEQDDAKCFSYHGKMYMVQGQLRRSGAGKGEIVMFQFCIEAFDTEKLIWRTN